MENSIGQSLRRATNRVDLYFNRLFAAEDLTYAQWTTLMLLRERQVATATDLARDQCYDAGSLSRAIEILTRRGFIKRIRSKSDRRTVLLSLTASGQTLLRHLLPDVVNAWNSLLAGFDRAEVMQLADMLKRLCPPPD